MLFLILVRVFGILKTAIKENISKNVMAKDLKLFKVNIPLEDTSKENAIFYVPKWY
jgi:hypothetical protein